MSRNKLKKLIATIIIVVVAILSGVGVTIAITDDGVVDEPVKYADEDIPALIINENGEEEEVDAETVEFVDSEIVTGEDECEEGQECGLGSFIYAPVDTPQAFKDYTLGKCLNYDNHYGAQCWDLVTVFWTNYTEDGRVLSTCGTGAAKGAWNCKEKNAGDEFELITDTHSLQPGDWIIFNNGQYGHVGMALGYYNNGYIALLGENQGGPKCPGGGAQTNIINMSLKSFAGAFRPKSYIVPEPEPEPESTPEPETSTDSNTVTYTYVKGDQFGEVLKKLGLANDSNLWGRNGKVRYYNAQLLEQGILNYYSGKYWNNIPIGTTITLNTEEN